MTVSNQITARFRYYCVDRDTFQVLGTNSRDVIREYVAREDYIVIDVAEQEVQLSATERECIFQSVQIAGETFNAL